MSAAGDRKRRERESIVEAGGFQFTIRRPTDAEALSFAGMDGMQILGRHVVGWNLREIDLYAGGMPEPVAFDADAFQEWIADRLELAGTLAEAIRDAYHAHRQKVEDAEKN